MPPPRRGHHGRTRGVLFNLMTVVAGLGLVVASWLARGTRPWGLAVLGLELVMIAIFPSDWPRRPHGRWESIQRR